MRIVCVAANVGVIVLMAIAAARAQDGRSEMNACLAALIRARIESQQAVRLSADDITLTKDTLRLTGHAWVRFNDASIRADEIVWNQATKGIDLIGNVNAFLGSATGCGEPARIEFR
jgi:lipopolysaccharide assembly outer membrane protein LptD (OstA)